MHVHIILVHVFILHFKLFIFAFQIKNRAFFVSSAVIIMSLQKYTLIIYLFNYTNKQKVQYVKQNPAILIQI